MKIHLLIAKFFVHPTVYTTLVFSVAFSLVLMLCMNDIEVSHKPFF